MIAKLILTFALGVPLCLVLNTASCGPTCGTLTSCGTSNATSDAGTSSAGSGGATTCPQLTAEQDCLTAYCKTADNPFCTCYNRGFDLAAAPDCTCTPFDATTAASFCQQAADNGLDADSFDCSAATGAVESLCVDVQ